MIPWLVSAIIPAYNQAAFVSQAIESVLDQTCAEREVIVVDDGSTDETAEVVARYGDRVRQVTQANAGLAAARNTGIRHARGEYLAFLDADDVWLPQKLEAQMAVFREAPEVGLVQTGYLHVNTDLRRLSPPVLPPADAGDSLGFVLPYNRMAVLAVVLRSEWIGRVGPFETSLRACEDWDLWIRLALAGCRFATVPEALALYRLHGANMSYDPTRMVTAAFATLDRAFKHPTSARLGEPLKLASYREQYLKASISFEIAGDEEKAAHYLRQALVAACPAIKNEEDPLALLTRYAWYPVWPPAPVSEALAQRRVYRTLAAIASLRVARGRSTDAFGRSFGDADGSPSVMLSRSEASPRPRSDSVQEMLRSAQHDGGTVSPSAPDRGGALLPKPALVKREAYALPHSSLITHHSSLITKPALAKLEAYALLLAATLASQAGPARSISLRARAVRVDPAILGDARFYPARFRRLADRLQKGVGRWTGRP
ncbi:MAG: glycosyltransferase [Chloroflexi bacterium]|nr:glycosyltransferase [Chloroflexota bacterium]